MTRKDPVALGLVTARGGSRDIPRKNVQMVGGRPLIAWTIEAALASQSLTRVIVSTDDAEIEQVSRDCGAEVPFRRPASLAQDDSPHIDVIAHALQWLTDREGYSPDYVVLLQPTSPLRTMEDIDASVDLAFRYEADCVLSVSESPAHPFLIKRITERGLLEDFVDTPKSYLPRQCLPPAYVVNGAIFLAKPDVILAERTWYTGRTYPYVMSPERSLDVDTPWDLYLADLVLRDRLTTSRS